MSRLQSRSGNGRWRLWLGAATAAAFLAAPASAQAAPFVYVTNGLSKSVSQYHVGPGGLLAPLSPPTVAAGAFAGGPAVSPDGQSLYVANSGGSNGPPSVSQYDVGPGGKLSPKSPATVAAGYIPVEVAVSPDGHSVYVTQISHSGADSVLQYDVGAGGKLSPKSPAQVATARYSDPIGVAVSPDGDSVYVTNFNGTIPNFDGSTVSQYDVGAGGKLSPKHPARVGTDYQPFELAVSPDGHSVYVAGGRSQEIGTVSQFDVGAGGKLTPKNPAQVFASEAPLGVAVSPDGDNVYVVNSSSDNVSQYHVGQGGKLAPLSPPIVAAGFLAGYVAVSPNSQSVYVTNFARSVADSSGSVLQYDVGAGGALQANSPPTVAAGDGASGVAVSQVPTTKGQCKHGGWKRFGFKNQGQCIRFVKHAQKR